MTGFVNALGILIFCAPGAAFLESTTANRWPVRPDAAYRPVGAARLLRLSGAADAIVALTLYTATTGQQLPTVGDEGSMSGGLPGFTALTVPLNLTTLQIIWPCALSIAFVGLMESLLTAKLVDDLTHTPSNKSSRKAPGWVSPISLPAAMAASPAAR